MYNLTISPSSIAGFRSCPHSWILEQRHGRIQKRSNALATGLLWHRWLEAFYNEMQSKQDGDSQWHKKFSHNTPELMAGLIWETSEDEQKAIINLNDFATAYKLFSAENDKEFNVVGTEYKLEFEIEVLGLKVLVRGIIDLVVEELGLTYIYDHKTSGRMSSFENSLQGRIYAWLWAKNFPDPEKSDLTMTWNLINSNPPRPPKLLADGSHSLNKSQRTTSSLYRQNLSASQAKDPKTIEFLNLLELQDHKFFKRENFILGADDLEATEIAIVKTAEDMIRLKKEIGVLNNKTKLAMEYAAPSQSCDWCVYKDFCLTAMGGG